MPKYKAEDHHARHVEDQLHARDLKHLRARKYGATVIVESGPDDDALKHFRTRRDTVHVWLLDIADHRGKWERTPFRGELDELVGVVVEQFGWTITDVFADPERTSDPRH